MGWRITGTIPQLFNSYNTIAYVQDDGRITDSDGWGANTLGELRNNGDIIDTNKGLYGDYIGCIREDGTVENRDGKILCYIHSNGNICDTYEEDTNWICRTLGHVEPNGSATGILGRIISNKKESSYNSNYSSNSESSYSSDSSSDSLYSSSYDTSYGSSYSSGYSSGYSSSYSSGTSIGGGSYSYSGPGSKWSYFSKSSEDTQKVTSNNYEVNKTTLEEHPEKAWLITAIVFSLLTLIDLLGGSSRFIPFESIVTIIAWIVFIIKIYNN